MKVKIYVEGGGDSSSLKADCRKGFSQFFEKLGFKGKMPSIVACGGRLNAIDQFVNSLSREDDVCSFLLIDSEDLLPQDFTDSKIFITNRDLKTGKLQFPRELDSNKIHLMVCCMESWLLCDVGAMSKFYGKDFNSKKIMSLPSNIESVPKSEIYSILDESTKNTAAGKYNKGRHSFELLGAIDSMKVMARSENANKLKNELSKFLV